MFATYFGNPELVNEEVAKYQAVTAEQVNAFARTYLGREQSRESALCPEERLAQ
jgi:predicted Zn-dependent peptidase